MPASRLLRGLPTQPYAFGPLGDAPAEAAAFIPFPAFDGAGAPDDEGPEAQGVSDPGAFLPFEVAPTAPTSTPLTDPNAAYEDGRQAGLAEAAADADALREEVERLETALAACKAAAEKRATFADRAAERLHQAWHRACDELQLPLASLALETAEAVLDAPLSPEQRAATEASLSAALDTLAEMAPLTIALHPIDLLHLQETGLATALETTHTGLRWASDTALAEGDWTVTSSEGAVRRVRADMLAALRERLHLDD